MADLSGNYTLINTYVDGSILTTSKYAADHQNHITNQNPTGNLRTTLRTTIDPGSDVINGDFAYRTSVVSPPQPTGTVIFFVQPAPLGDLALPPF